MELPDPFQFSSNKFFNQSIKNNLKVELVDGTCWLGETGFYFFIFLVFYCIQVKLCFLFRGISTAIVLFDSVSLAICFTFTVGQLSIMTVQAADSSPV